MEGFTLLDIIGTVGGVASPLVTIFVLWKIGLIGNGKKNGLVQGQIDELRKHAETSNHEVGLIQQHILEIKEDISYIKGKLSNE